VIRTADGRHANECAAFNPGPVYIDRVLRLLMRQRDVIRVHNDFALREHAVGKHAHPTCDAEIYGKANYFAMNGA
jgi:hypothetical protein